MNKTILKLTTKLASNYTNTGLPKEFRWNRTNGDKGTNLPPVPVSATGNSKPDIHSLSETLRTGLRIVESLKKAE